jgi:hypothetical protein
MQKHTVQTLLFVLSGLYVLGTMAYVYWHASNIADTIYKRANVDVSFKSVNNPFWRWDPLVRSILAADSDLKRYADRIEITKYLLIVGGLALFGLNVVIAAFWRT